MAIGTTRTITTRKVSRVFRSKFLRKQGRAGFLFALPAMLFFGLFALYPMVMNAYLSLFEYNLLQDPTFIGLGNYSSISQDPLFYQSLRASVIYVFGTYVPLWFVALGLALALNRNLRFQGLFRSLFFVPVVMSMVVVAVIWKLMYHPFGLVNTLLSGIIYEPIQWLTSTTMAPVALIVMSLWKNFGYFMVIFLAGLQGIPHEYYEAARIDGANGRQLFRRITLPLLKPITLFVVIMSILMGFQEFTAPYVMTGGGPAGATRVIPQLIYETGFEFLKMGRAAAISMILFCLLLVFTLLQLRISRARA